MSDSHPSHARILYARTHICKHIRTQRPLNTPAIPTVHQLLISSVSIEHSQHFIKFRFSITKIYKSFALPYSLRFVLLYWNFDFWQVCYSLNYNAAHRLPAIQEMLFDIWWKFFPVDRNGFPTFLISGYEISIWIVILSLVGYSSVYTSPLEKKVCRTISILLTLYVDNYGIGILQLRLIPCTFYYRLFVHAVVVQLLSYHFSYLL